MPTTTLTTKGQVTLPKEIRDELGLKEGVRLDVRVEDGHIVMYPKTKRLEDLIGFLKTDRPAVSIEEMNEGIAAAVTAKYKRLRDRR